MSMDDLGQPLCVIYMFFVANHTNMNKYRPTVNCIPGTLVSDSVRFVDVHGDCMEEAS